LAHLLTGWQRYDADLSEQKRTTGRLPVLSPSHPEEAFFQIDISAFSTAGLVSREMLALLEIRMAQ
jgi:hypothetical protein